MASLLARWDFDDTTEWLRPVDMFLAVELVKAAATGGDRAPSALEIGVWKGAWLIQLLQACPGALGVGIDPYPATPTLRQQVVDRAASRGLADRFSLLPTPDEACEQHCDGGEAHREFSIVHVDGLHVEDQVMQDLRYAARHCGDDGIVVVDDYRAPAYPGIPSAMYRFLAEREFAMFLVTPSKAYLCRAGAHADRWQAAVDVLDRAGLHWERYSGERTGPRIVQRPDVMGFGVVLCLSARNDARVLAGLDRPLGLRVRGAADRWLPKGVRDPLRSVKRRLAGGSQRG